LSEPAEVLIVEDDADYRQTLHEVLAEEGYCIAGAGDGREALDYLQRAGAPRLILLDLMMPVMDGWQLLAELKRSSTWAMIPVVVMTAFRDRNLALEHAQLLCKPIDLKDLLALVQRVIGRPPATLVREAKGPLMVD
jgi:CheY-like chemotaxis protein